MKQYVFVIQGYDTMDENGRLNEVVTFELFAPTSKAAIKRAKELIKKNNYRVASVIEKEPE